MVGNLGRILTQEDVIDRIKEVHGDTYDLSRVIYENRRTKIELVCKEHGSWFTTTEQLFRGQGCFTCGKQKAADSKKILFNEFVKMARKIHGDRYIYSKSQYSMFTEKTTINCSFHGSFVQRPDSHIKQGQGCPDCGRQSQTEKRKMPLEDFIEKANLIHSDKYDYSKVKYKNNRTKIKIICPEHNSFMQLPDNHLNGHACPKCSTEAGHELQKKTTEEFIENSIRVHGDKYGYSKTVYFDNRTGVEIVCKKHGVFTQNPYSHQSGSGCPNCNISKGEDLVKSILEINQIKYFQQHKFSNLKHVGNLRCDFYLPDYNLVIEYNGKQHYEVVSAFGGDKGFKSTQKRDQIKRDYLKEKGINLLEIHYKNDDVESEILNCLSILNG